MTNAPWSVDNCNSHYADIRKRLRDGVPVPKMIAPPPAPEPIPEPALPMIVVPRDERADALARVARMPEMFAADRARKIVARIAVENEIPVDQIMGKSRFKHVVAARARAVKEVALVNRDWTLSQLGRFFHRDHTTILHFLQKAGVSRPWRPVWPEMVPTQVDDAPAQG